MSEKMTKEKALGLLNNTLKREISWMRTMVKSCGKEMIEYTEKWIDDIDEAFKMLLQQVEENAKLKQELKSLKDKQGSGERELIKSLEKLLRTTKNNWIYLQYSDNLYYVNTYKEVYYEGKNLIEALKKLEKK